MAHVTCQIVWIFGLLKDLEIEHKGPTIIYYNN